MRIEALGGRTIVQHLMHCFADNECLQWRCVDPTSHDIIDLMFAHLRSIKLLRVFPYILLMDTTYMTNKY